MSSECLRLQSHLAHLPRLLPTCSDSSYTCSGSSLPAQTPPTPAQAPPTPAQPPPYLFRLLPHLLRLLPTCSDSSHSYSDSSPSLRLLPSLRGSTSISHSPSSSLWVLPLLVFFSPLECSGKVLRDEHIQGSLGLAIICITLLLPLEPPGGIHGPWQECADLLYSRPLRSL